MNNLVRTILGLLLSAALLVVIVFEFKTGFNMVKERQLEFTSAAIGAASESGQASVNIVELTTYPEVSAIWEYGSTLKVQGYNVKLKVNGDSVDDSQRDAGIYTYTSFDKKVKEDITVKQYTSNVTELRNAVKDFWYGDDSSLREFLDIGDTYLSQQCTFRNGNAPMFNNESLGSYIMVVPGEAEYYLVIESKEPFRLSDEKVTVVYPNPKDNPQFYHTYSWYEETAAANTLAELADDGNIVINNPYEETGVTGTTSSYTSKADEALRTQMASLGNYEWDSEGKSDETTTTVDIKSEEAMKSKWELDATTYNYEVAGLKLYALTGTRTQESLAIEGTVENTLDSERPYVVVVKYLDSNGGLVGLRVVDKRSNPIKAKATDRFSIAVSPARDKIDIQKVAAVMFEVY